MSRHVTIRRRPTPGIRVGRLVVFPTGPARRWGRSTGVLATYVGLGPVTLEWTR